MDFENKIMKTSKTNFHDTFFAKLGIIISCNERSDNTRMLYGDWILMAYTSRSLVKQTAKNTHGIYFSGFWLVCPPKPQW